MTCAHEGGSVFAVKLVLACAFLLCACGGPEAPPAPDPDRARECDPPEFDAGMRDGGARRSCASGEICIEGRCYDKCGSDSDCGPGETCSPSGACLRNADAGVDPCGGSCDAPLVCHPRAHACVACSSDTIGASQGEPGFCELATPVCDVANGECVAPSASFCAPCNTTTDCQVVGGFMGACVIRTAGSEIQEQVCLTPCDTTACAAPLVCQPVGGGMFCVPPIDIPCTNWRTAVSRASCGFDADCAALGADNSLYVDACEGEVGDGDGGVITPGRCLQPCGMTTECFNAAGGQTCTGTPGFCRP
jgi:hypothetical protein